ncbi:MAG TPA: TetR family transcriptional regulator [Solirubrobacteraceae bacterium]|nr:TetR family transcriptional regulator [Solirubrobacteraceae bacterium]
MASTDARPPRARRLTQAERSANTREALLDATIDSLIELGFQASTTAEISERAGLSRGAHLHHFQTRGALIGAAVDHLLNRSASELAESVEGLPAGDRRPKAALEMLWRQFNGPLFAAVLELSVQARTDPELRERLEDVERVVHREAMPWLRRAFGAEPDSTEKDDLIVLVTSTIRGLAMLPILEPHQRVEKAWSFCRGQLLTLLRDAPA